MRGRAPERAGVGRRKRGLALAFDQFGPIVLHALDPAVEHLGLAGPVLGAGPHRVGQGAELADLSVLEGALLLPLLDVGAQLGPVGAVVPLEFPEAPLGQAQDLGDDAVEQLEVVADDEHRPRKPRELGHEPSLGGEVEMVGRLVEHERVGPAEQDPDDVDAPALSTRERVDVVEQHVLAEPDPLGEPCDLAFEAVSPDGAVALLEVGEGGDGLGGGVQGHRGARLVQLLVEDVEATGGQHMGEAGGLEPQTSRRRNLGQEADGALDVHGPRDPEVGRGLSADHRHQGRLARAVAADEPHLVVGPDHERRVAEAASCHRSRW